jgi:short-subunit dehydrogenase
MAGTGRYRSALVTGASSGIGWAFAHELAARGADLIIVARRTDRLEQLARELAGCKVEVLTADLSTDAGVSAVEQRLAADPVELLVNNAGVSTAGRFVDQSHEAEAGEVFVNVVALHRLTHAAIGPMVTAGRGGVINVASLAGDQPLRGFATYSATKAFVIQFSEALHAEVKPSGVHVTVLKPGYVWTEMNPEGPEPRSLAGRFWLRPEVVARHALDAVEAGKLHSVPGAHYRLASAAVNALPDQLVRALSTRFDGT